MQIRYTIKLMMR